jgi:aspartyl-tRNA(Asn)/glutamyl-tRNA(Gln) amidotransferase subunit A
VTTRELFQQAVAWLQQHPVLDLDGRPAFTYRPLDAPPAKDSLQLTTQDKLVDQSPPGTVCGVAQAIRAGKLSARAAVTSCLERITTLNPKLHAFVCVLEEAALRQAAELDREAQRGRLRGPLHGVPLSVKDVIHVAGVPTSASSRVLSGFVPEEDACAVERIKAAGAIVIGKTETHEFALGVTTPQSRNPWDETRIPGGSTGGTAIAVATGMAPGGLGTDTRASIRVPAALSGVVGFKPTFGLVPTHGVVTLSWSMDHVAPMGATVKDAALLLDVIAGRDGRDPNSVERPESSYSGYVGRSVNKLRIGVPTAAFERIDDEVSRAVWRAIEGLKSAIASVQSVEQPSTEDLEMSNMAGLIVSRAEAATFHQPWLKNKAHLYTDETRDQLEEALNVSAVAYLMAQRHREEFRRRMVELFARVDVLALPTCLVVAPPVAEADQFLMVLSRNCIPWSFIGFPAISVPCGRSASGLPIGLQLVAAPFRDASLIAAASAIETFELFPRPTPLPRH